MVARLAVVAGLTVVGSRVAHAQTAPPAEVAAQEAAPTRATFLSTSALPWDVAVDGQVVCTTPCTAPLHPTQFVTLLSQERRPVLLDVGRLPPGEVTVEGKPFEHGTYAGGIVATSLGGMALVTGTTLAAIGLAKDRGGMTTAGAISGAVGALAVLGGIYLMVKAVPGFSVARVR